MYKTVKKETKTIKLGNEKMVMRLSISPADDIDMFMVPVDNRPCSQTETFSIGPNDDKEMYEIIKRNFRGLGEVVMFDTGDDLTQAGMFLSWDNKRKPVYTFAIIDMSNNDNNKKTVNARFKYNREGNEALRNSINEACDIKPLKDDRRCPYCKRWLTGKYASGLKAISIT